MRKFFVFLLVIMLTSVSSIQAQQLSDNKSNGVLTEKEQQLLNERSNVVREYFLKVEQKKAEIDKIESVKRNPENILHPLEMQRLEEEINSARFELEVLEASYADYGLEKISEVKKDEVSILVSSATDYDITEIQLFYDTLVSKYILHSAGNFTTDAWKEDVTTIFYGWSNLGGYEGYSLYSLHKDINTYNQEFHTLYYDDPTISINWTNSASKYPDSRGYAWKYQDQIYSTFFTGSVTDYNNWRQLGWYYFDFVSGVPTGQTISFSASFGHTWSSTTINSISYPAGFGWSTTNHKWNDGKSAAFSF